MKQVNMTVCEMRSKTDKNLAKKSDNVLPFLHTQSPGIASHLTKELILVPRHAQLLNPVSNESFKSQPATTMTATFPYAASNEAAKESFYDVLAAATATTTATASLNSANKEQQPFDIYASIDKIITKYNGLSSDKQRRLNMPLDETIKQNLDERRADICANLNVNELVNQHMLNLLSSDEVSSIQDARGTDKNRLFFTAVKKNIRCLITFLIGLKETQHEQRFHYFCTKEFCDKLVSILDKL
uniref:Uncharacterized protein n=1 Tax=Plectus sambesii TaxID=2011161 RepID=A0A914WC22_9BILA